MRIHEVEVIKVEVPLARPYVISRGPTHSFRQVLVLIRGEDGTTGVGECALFSVVGNWDAVYEALLGFAGVIRGLDSWDIEGILDRMQAGEQPDLAPVAAIDMALWDLNGKSLEIPVYKLLGSAVNKALPVDYTLGQEAPLEMARRAVQIADQAGFTGFCVKVAGKHSSIELDQARVREVRAALGNDYSIRADANAGYSAAEAVEFLRGVQDCNLEFIEQPVAAGDLEALKRVRAATDTRISIDEGLQRLADAHRHAASGAVDIFNIKIPKCGGFHLSRKIAAVAESAGIPCICGGALSLEVVRQASRHFAVGVRLGEHKLCQEGPGPASQALAGNVTRRVVSYEDVRGWSGSVRLTDEPGLGVEPDFEQIARFRVA